MSGVCMDTNMVKKMQDGAMDNSFLLDEKLPNPSVEFKKHMAKKFKGMGMSLDQIRQLISVME